MDDPLRTAYRAESFSELCAECRKPTGTRCYECNTPLCDEHAHQQCLSCQRPATDYCRRCGNGVCISHRPSRKDRRCPLCEQALWNWADALSVGNAPARAKDFGAILALFGSAVALFPVAPGVAGAAGAAGFGWPALKMGYLRMRRAALIKQLRPDFLREKHPSRVSCGKWAKGDSKDEPPVTSLGDQLGSLR